VLRTCVISGGVGAARFLRGLLAEVPAGHVSAVVNVGDDCTVHGLEVSPDLDTITYTLAGAVDPGAGWGLRGETWHAMEQVRRYAAANGRAGDGRPGDDAAGWFALGDRDLGTHLYRTSRRRAGVPLSAVTAEVAAAWGLELALLPASDDPVRTVLDTADGGSLSFQQYFVRERHAVEVRAVRIEGAGAARPGPGVLEAISAADVVVVAPSNPIVSIDPVLAVPGVRDAVAARRDRVIGVSPIVSGAPVEGPAHRFLRGAGYHECSARQMAEIYRDVCATFVIHESDAGEADDIEALGVRPVLADILMPDRASRAQLARTVIEAAG